MVSCVLFRGASRAHLLIARELADDGVERAEANNAGQEKNHTDGGQDPLHGTRQDDKGSGEDNQPNANPNNALDFSFVSGEHNTFIHSLTYFLLIKHFRRKPERDSTMLFGTYAIQFT